MITFIWTIGIIWAIGVVFSLIIGVKELRSAPLMPDEYGTIYEFIEYENYKRD